MRRVLLYTKDVQIITGKSERASRTLIKKMKLHFNKLPHHAITIDEFCEYYNIRKENLPFLG